MYRKLPTVLAAAAALAICLPLSAAMVLQMNLEQMVSHSARIFRGTVLDIREGKIQAGGGELPTVTYRIRVDEALKGTFQQVKGMQVAEIRMVGTKKAGGTGAVQALSVLPDLPKLQVGKDYLLIATAPSAIGLSTTVGLGQGAFELMGKPGQELAVNGNQNRGLFLGMNGPAGFAAEPEEGAIAYSTLAGMIRDIVSQ